MSLKNTTSFLRRSRPGPQTARPRLTLVPIPPRILADLRPRQCRYCVADAPKGDMDQALFCAAPARFGPYCAEHTAMTRRAEPFDLDAAWAEIRPFLRPGRPPF